MDVTTHHMPAKKPFYKRWWFLGLLILFVLGGIGNLLDSASSSTTDATSTPTPVAQSTAPTLFTGDSSSLLPVRSEIDTEYVIEDKGYGASGMDIGIRDDPNIGQKDRSYMVLSLTESSITTSMAIEVFKFDSVENARRYYTETVNGIKEEGGYKEVDISVPKATCFSIEQRPAHFTRTAYCQKANVVFITTIGTYNIGRLNEYLDFAKLVASKI